MNNSYRNFHKVYQVFVQQNIALSSSTSKLPGGCWKSTKITGFQNMHTEAQILMRFIIRTSWTLSNKRRHVKFELPY